MKFSTFNENKNNRFDIPQLGEYHKLSDLDVNAIYIVKGFFIIDSKFGKHPIVYVLDKLVSLPNRYTNIFEEILKNEGMCTAIDNGECKFKVNKFYSKKYNRDGWGIEFVD